MKEYNDLKYVQKRRAKQWKFIDGFIPLTLVERFKLWNISDINDIITRRFPELCAEDSYHLTIQCLYDKHNLEDQ